MKPSKTDVLAENQGNGVEDRRGQESRVARNTSCDQRFGSVSSRWRKLGMVGFLFFAVKGILWLGAGYAALSANGCMLDRS